jgi:hypothetical protein
MADGTFHRFLLVNLEDAYAAIVTPANRRLRFDNVILRLSSLVENECFTLMIFVIARIPQNKVGMGQNLDSK